MIYTQEQQNIIRSKDKHVVVIANAGTGKTTTIIEKIKYLIEHENVKPYTIMLTSFSRVAASELYEKAVKSVGQVKADQLHIGTIHSICYKILIENIKLLNISKIDITFEAYLTAIVFNKHTNLFVSKKDATEAVSAFRKYLLDGKYPNRIGDDKFNAVKEAQELVESWGKFLFDDLLIKAVYLLEKYPEIRNKWQNTFDYIFCDEVQDTNEIQWKIISILSSDHTNTVVIGDAKQSLYGFRGCSYLFLEEYRKKVNASVCTLTETFRFGQPFADVSNKIIDSLDIDEVYKKHTVTKIDRTTKPEFKQLSADDQVNDVVERIKQNLLEGYSYKDLNVVYRYNKESIPFMKAFIKNKIPFVVKTGDVFERIELKFVINALMLLKSFNISDCITFFSMYSDFVGDKTLTSIYEKINNPTDILDFLTKIEKTEIAKVGPQKRKSLNKMKDRFEELQKIVKNNSIPEVADVMDMGMTKFMLKELEAANQGNPSEDRKEFLHFFQECFQDSQQESIIDWYNDILLNGHKVQEKEKNDVYLKTIHGCKGQTLPIVYFIANKIAYADYTKTPEDFESEKFCLYVAITRAEKQLCIYVNNPVSFAFPFIFPDEWIKQIEILKENNVNPFEQKVEEKISKVESVKASDKKIKSRFTIKHSTEKAICFSDNSKQFWVPIMYITKKDDDYYICDWIVKKNNYSDYVEKVV